MIEHKAMEADVDCLSADTKSEASNCIKNVLLNYPEYTL